MKKILLLFLFFPFFSEALLITEIQVAGEEDVNESYIKIYNPQNIAIDISGYNLRKKTSSGNDASLRVFPSESIIGAQDYFIWASSRIDSYPENINADVSSKQYLSSNNSVALLNKERDLIDSVVWGSGEDQYFNGSPLLNPLPGQIIKRKLSDSLYVDTRDNLQDFLLFPEIEEKPFQEKTSFTKEKNNEQKRNPFLISFFSSIVLAFIVLYINGRTQSL